MTTLQKFSIPETSRRSKRMFKKFVGELFDVLPNFYLISIDIDWQNETQFGFDHKTNVRNDVPTGRRWVRVSLELYNKKEWKKRYGR